MVFGSDFPSRLPNLQTPYAASHFSLIFKEFLFVFHIFPGFLYAFHTFFRENLRSANTFFRKNAISTQRAIK
jgi:hypothetical protein